MAHAHAAQLHRTKGASKAQDAPAPRTRIAEMWAFLDTTRVRILIIAAVIVLGLVYLWLVNSSATAGFYLSDLESQVFAMEDEYEKLQLEKTALRSLEHIQEQGKAMELVASGRADYSTDDSAVALHEVE